MGKEIERKFKVKDDSYKYTAEGVLYRQGYLNSNLSSTVRVRIIKDKGYITIKGPIVGIVRSEYEYEIPYEDASSIIDELCEKPIVEKYRYKVEDNGVIWEIDEFIGENEGLIIAEVELENERQKISMPKWIGEEVTGDYRYSNSNLVKKPFSTW